MSIPGGLNGGSGLGAFGAGGPLLQQSFALPTLAKLARPYVAHLYTRDLVFKRTLGGATVTQPGLLNKPGLKLTQNGGFQAVTLNLSAPTTGATAIALGDVIRLTEEGDNTGAYVFSGNVETVPEDQSPSATLHQVTLAPWITELGDGYFNQTYAAPVDVAQWVRDAVATTKHCSVSPVSCPDTGVVLAYDFQNSNPLDALHVAKQAAGANYWYGCDEQGLVWFQPVYTDANHPATLTLRKGAEAASRKPLTTRAGRITKIPIVGGNNAGDGSRLTSLYDGSVAAGFTKAFNPTLSFPTVTSQATLNAIAAALGALYDRDLHTDEVFCPALGLRLSPFRVGGLTVRVWESAVEPLQESGEPGAGGYGPTLILQDVERVGPSQRLFLSDIPFTDIDPAYEAARVAQRIAVVAAPVVPTAALVAPPAPATTSRTFGPIPSTTGIFAAGGGTVQTSLATFITTRAGTIQVIASIDARMEAWDNTVAAPRRAVRAVISGGIFTGSWQELPFGIARGTFDLSSSAGISLPAGTYTMEVDIITTATNQMHVYSGYVEVFWTG